MGKQGRMAMALRRRIISGTWAPGSRIPPHRVLADQFRVSTRTIYQVLDRVNADGFLKPVDRSGTFVASHPPHLYRYGLVFPWEEPEDRSSLLWQALLRAAECSSKDTNYTFAAYHGIDHANGHGDYCRLVDDIRRRRLAGIIFTSPPAVLDGSPLLEQERVPCVALQSQYLMPWIGWMDTRDAHKRCLNNALRYLREQGRSRLGIIDLITAQLGLGCLFADVQQAASEYGMQTERHWVHGAKPGRWDLLRNVLDALMRLPASNRPDAFYVTDDNLVADVGRACVSLGIRVPEDLILAGHANFPCPPQADVPVYLTGFDLREFLNSCLKWFEAERQGRQPSRGIEVKAYSEDEVAAQAK